MFYHDMPNAATHASAIKVTHRKTTGKVAIPETRQATIHEMATKALRQLASKVEQHFAFTDGSHMRENGRVVSLFKASVDFDVLPPNKQAVVLREFSAEGMGDKKYEYRYTFTTFIEAELPSSYWERVAATFIDSPTSTTFPKHYNKIVVLEKDILQSGFDVNAPITVGCLPPQDDKGRVMLDGGNHRVQAVRNLIKAGLLDSKFRIPTMATFMDHHWDKF